MKLSTLLSNVEIKRPYRDRGISAVAVNSETVRGGELFIAMNGVKKDGHNYIGAAISNGAACVLSDSPVYGIPDDKLVLVENCRVAAAFVYSELYGNPAADMRLIAVTGTNGKTTVAKLTEHILRYAGYKTGFVGTLGMSVDGELLDMPELSSEDPVSTMTTPPPEYLYKALRKMKDKGCDAVVMEASSHALALSRLDALHFDIGMFLNLSRDHLDYHLTVENYFNAKKRIALLSKQLIVNFDDKYGRRISEECDGALSFSAMPETVADDRVCATACACKDRGVHGMEYLYYSKNAVFRTETPMWGMNAVYNSMASSLSALTLGVSPATVEEATASFKGVRGRMEVLPTAPGEAVFIIDYAHTPDALEKALIGTRTALRSGRLVLVFGCGGERDTAKRKMMGEVADKYADFTYLTNDNPRGEDPLNILGMIEAGFSKADNHITIPDRRCALVTAVDESRAGDIVLICGKGHENYIIDSLGKHCFSEKKIIAEALENKRAEHNKT